MKKKASRFKRRPSQKIKILHTQKVAAVFNFYRALHFFVRVLFTTVSSYYCDVSETHARYIKLSPEHKEVGWFNFHQIKNLNMPKGYKNSIITVKKHFI